MVTRGTLVLVSASLLSMALGSVHAFSVFLEPLEQSFHASRSLVSLTYSLALVAITVAVLLGYRVFAKWSASRMVWAVCVLAAAGALVAAYAPSLAWVWLGYSGLFGIANGLGYGFGLQISAQANPGRGGISMGIVTAFYALGAAVSPALFAGAVSVGGFRTAMLDLAASLIVIAPICARLMTIAGARFAALHTEAGQPRVRLRQYILLWLGYGSGVAAGLMTIGHAAGIAKVLGFAGAPWVSPVLIAICNMAGSFAGGWMVDRLTPARPLFWLPLMSASALVLLVFQNSIAVAFFCLGAVGFSYGATIAAYPAAVARMFGSSDSARIYGRVFTAWGSAGLFAPWLAGFLFDWTQGYAVALSAAAALGIVSALVTFALFRSGQSLRRS
ncbi:MAG: MFS transporter [Paracoccaceae bacterium]